MSVVTKNAISTMRSAPKKEGTYFTVQVIDIKTVGSGRYRAIISDSEHFDQSFIGGPSHHFFANSMVKVFQLIKIKDYSISELNGSLIITLQEIEPGASLKGMQGSPIKYEPKAQAVQKPIQKPITNKENQEFTSVKTLTSSSKDFVIKARVTKKTAMKEWKNERGAGKLFSVNIIDTFSEEISVTFFKDEAEKFFPVIQEGKVYIFKNGQVKICNKRFQTVDNEYSIFVDRKTEIIQTTDECEISTIKCAPVLIDNLASAQVDSLVDVCGAIIEVSELSELVSKKTNKPMKKRVIKIVDQSNALIELTLWNEEAENTIFILPSLPIYFVGKGLRVSNFNGVTLNTDRSSSQMLFNPDMPQIKSIKAWLARNPSLTNTKILSMRASLPLTNKNYMSLAEIKHESEANDKEGAYLINACVGFIRNDPSLMFYTACKNTSKCKKKVIRDGNSWYRCESCQESFEECEYKYMVTMRLQDFSEALWVTAFDDSACIILGHSAASLHNTYIDNSELFDEILEKATMKRIEGTVKVKMSETAQGKRPKYTLSYAKCPDHAKSLKRNLEIISELVNCFN